MNSVREPYKSMDVLAEKFIPNSEANKVGALSSSIWSNILYGIGMLAYLMIPPMIPGVTAFDLIVFNIGLVVFIYFVAFIVQGVKAIRFNKKRHR